MNKNYYPETMKELQIPDFLKSANNLDDKIIQETQQELNKSVEEGESARINGYHLNELSKQAAAYSEEEARAVIHSIVNEYPTIIFEELGSYVEEMNSLVGSILKNSKEFAQKRG